MGIFDMFSGRKARLALIEAERRQTMLQLQQMQMEQQQQAEAKRQFQLEQGRLDSETARANAETKRRALDDSVARLGGFSGYRSLLSGRKGGGGFGPRSMLDAA